MEKKSIKVILPAFEVDWINSFCTSYYFWLMTELNGSTEFDDYAEDYNKINDLLSDRDKFEYFLPREVCNFIMFSCLHAQKQNPSDCHYALCILSDLYLALDFALYNK